MQSHLSAIFIILQMIWHIACMDDDVDAKRILLASPPADCRRQPGRPRNHVAEHRPTGAETPPPYASRSSRDGSEPPSVEDVDAWRYAILRVACQKRRRKWLSDGHWVYM